MNARLALIAVAAIPVLALMFHLLGQSGLRPLTGYLIGMSVYWGLLALALTRGGWSLAWRWPPLWLVLVLALVAAAALTKALPVLPRLSPHVLALVALAAVLNGTLEEAFWRGALVRDLQRGDWRPAVVPCLLFIAWHLAPAAGLAALQVPGGVPGFLLAAAAFAPLMMAARLTSGTAGVAAATHILVNFGMFAMLATTNHAPA